MIEKFLGSAPTFLEDFPSRLCFVACVLVLAIIAFLLPKKPLAKKIVGGILLAGVIAVLTMPLYVADMAKFVYSAGFSTYMMIFTAVVLLYGFVFNNSNLSQVLYGITISIVLPISLIRFLLPSWLPSWLPSLDAIFKYRAAWVPLMVYALLFFISVWLVASGTYRLSFNTIWHVLYGGVIVGSLISMAFQAGVIRSATAQLLANLYSNGSINTQAISYFALFGGIALGVIFIVSLIATLLRKYVSKSGEKIIASETKKAFVLRLVGKIVAVAASGACLVFLPSLLGATTEANLAGMPKALLFLAPIVILAVVMLVFEFLAEDHEIKVAQAAYEAEVSAE